MDKDAIKVAGYVRVSTDSQVRHGYSLDEQREEIVRYCDMQQYDLLEIFSDEGISGAQENEDEMTVARDGLLDMLVYVKEMGIRFVVVLNTSRLWRSDMVRVLIHRELKKCNADIGGNVKAIPNYCFASSYMTVDELTVDVDGRHYTVAYHQDQQNKKVPKDCAL